MISDATLARYLSRPTVALIGDLVRAILWALVVIAWLTYGAVYLRLGRLLTEPGSNDFTIFYYTARMVAEGRPMYGAVPAEYGLEWKGTHLGNLNPPHFQLLMLPLVPFGYRGALTVWGVANILLVALSLRVVVRELGNRLTRKQLLVGGIAIFAAVPWTSVAVTGEMSLLLLYPFTRAWVALRRDRWTEAGGWIGACVSLKLFFLVFIAWFVARGAWRAVIGATCAAGAVIAAGMLAFGTGVYGEWLQGLGRVGWWWLPMNASLKGLVERLVNPGRALAPVARAASLGRPIWLLLASVVVAATAWRTGPWARPTDADRTVLVLLLAALLVSPLGWVYYLPLATGPILALMHRGELFGSRFSRVAILLGLTLLYLPIEIAESAQPSAISTLTLASTYSWAVLSIWSGLVADRPTDRSAPFPIRG